VIDALGRRGQRRVGAHQRPFGLRGLLARLVGGFRCGDGGRVGPGRRGSRPDRSASPAPSSTTAACKVAVTSVAVTADNRWPAAAASRPTSALSSRTSR
jgi:hypothetical protein